MQSIAGHTCRCWRQPAAMRPHAAPVALHLASRPSCVVGSASVPSTSTSSSSTQEDLQQLKLQLRESLQGIDRGIFGTQAVKRESIAALVAQLEAHNPLQQPTRHLQQVAGDWRLLYTTISITGVKKTKLGLREFVKLGDFIQTIDIDSCTAVNKVVFSVAGLGNLSGSLTITAAYNPSSDDRVDITFQSAKLQPEALEALFKQNYALLLGIFNPEGWLDITYVDQELRVGRDDKGNIFVLERC